MLKITTTIHQVDKSEAIRFVLHKHGQTSVGSSSYFVTWNIMMDGNNHKEGKTYLVETLVETDAEMHLKDESKVPGFLLKEALVKHDEMKKEVKLTRQMLHLVLRAVPATVHVQQYPPVDPAPANRIELVSADRPANS